MLRSVSKASFLTRSRASSKFLSSTRSFSSSSYKVPISNFESTETLPYEKLEKRLHAVRRVRPTPLTLAEKIVYSHLDNPDDAKDIVRGKARRTQLDLLNDD